MSLTRLAIQIAVRGSHRHHADAVLGGESKSRIETTKLALTVEKTSIRDDGADMRFAVEVVLNPSDKRLRGLAKQRVGGAVYVAGAFVVGSEHPDGELAGLARQLGPEQRIDDGARVDQRDRGSDLKDLVAFDEERSQLGKEQWESLIDLDLRTIRLDLGEIGVEREVDHHVRRQAVLQVHAPFG